MSVYAFIPTILPNPKYPNFSVVHSSLKAIGLISSGAANNEIPTSTVDEQGIRLEFAQFGHFDSFDVIRSMTSMVGVADIDLPIPIATGLKTMYYVDANVVEGLTYYYKVRVWRGISKFVSAEIEIAAIKL